ncbi:histone-lysine N-methyltransferase SMYD3-like [Culicoides brevitarsis]|uniref:histone-lysine N-methyltransferase SMYD3-like n=1 Tax=Culicoides brevitarsis TaxID=469753 RepID=UPI00307BC009
MNNMKLKNQVFKRGTCILTEEPFVHVLKSKYRKERCDSCLSLGNLRKCSGCNYVYYCDHFCQKNGWDIHKYECPNLKDLRVNVPDAARVIAHIIFKLKNGGDMQRGYYSDNGYRKFRDLMSHYQEIKIDERRLEHLEAISVVLKTLIHPLLVPNENELMTIYGRLCTNGFNILDPEMNTIGTGIYLGVSIVDHSCKPNAVATFNGTQLRLHLTEELQNLQWQQVSISYIDLVNTREDRRKELKERYYFLCTCTRCVDVQEEEKMLAAACPNAKCGNGITNVAKMTENEKCEKCGEEIVVPAYKEKYEEVTEFTKEKLLEMKNVAYLDVLQLLLKRQENVLHDFNIWHIKTLDAAFESAINMEKWEEALEYGTRLLPGFRMYNGDFHPLLGIALMKIGKIELFLEKSVVAFKHLQEAAEILKVTHGEKHSLYKDQLIPLLQEAHAVSSNCLN